MSEVHLHLHVGDVLDRSDVLELLKNVTGSTTSIGIAAEANDEDAARVADVLARFRQYDPHSAAPALLELARELGYEVHPPRPRGGADRSNATYLRFRYVGATRTVVVYLNTVALFSAAQDQRAVAAGMSGADVRRGEVYFSHADGSSEIALRSFQVWADNG